ncbi:MAG: ATP-binding cassette domain-containing protein [Bacteroidota bacterium]
MVISIFLRAVANILEINTVSKRYGSKVAVDAVSLAIPRGSIFGLLGPNGAGKTSLIRMITTITRPDEGSILLGGEPLHADHPQQIGYLPEERGLYKKMKVGEHLIYLGRLKGLKKKKAKAAAENWLERLDLSDRWGQAVETLSKGLQQQVQFIATVIHEPQLLILDEPFSGLDPVNTNRLKAEIRKLHEGGTSIIFSTHRMEQVEEVCEYIALINAGRNVLEGRVNEIREQYKQNHFRVLYEGELPAGFATAFNVVTQRNQCLTIAPSEDLTRNQLLQALLNHGISIKAFNEVLPSLNEIFIKLVGEAETVPTP